MRKLVFLTLLLLFGLTNSSLGAVKVLQYPHPLVFFGGSTYSEACALYNTDSNAFSLWSGRIHHLENKKIELEQSGKTNGDSDYDRVVSRLSDAKKYAADELEGLEQYNKIDFGTLTISLSLDYLIPREKLQLKLLGRYLYLFNPQNIDFPILTETVLIEKATSLAIVVRAPLICPAIKQNGSIERAVDSIISEIFVQYQ